MKNLQPPLGRGSVRLLFKLAAIVNLSLLLIVSGLLPARADGPPARITGTVTGDNGEPLSGVSVQIKGSDIGTTTNSNGEYFLSVGDTATLVFSYIGYTTKEVGVAGQKIVNAQLATSNKALDQVVVIGYGSQRKANITSAVSTISIKDVTTRPLVSTSEILVGKSPGVQVVQPDGAPGGDFTIRVRGLGSPSGKAARAILL